MNMSISTNNPATLLQAAQRESRDPGVKLIAQALELMHKQQASRDQELAEAVREIQQHLGRR